MNLNQTRLAKGCFGDERGQFPSECGWVSGSLPERKDMKGQRGLRRMKPYLQFCLIVLSDYPPLPHTIANDLGDFQVGWYDPIGVGQLSLKDLVFDDPLEAIELARHFRDHQAACVPNQRFRLLPVVQSEDQFQRIAAGS